MREKDYEDEEKEREREPQVKEEEEIERKCEFVITREGAGLISLLLLSLILCLSVISNSSFFISIKGGLSKVIKLIVIVSTTTSPFIVTPSRKGEKEE
jgi:hypothetical protein